MKYIAKFMVILLGILPIVLSGEPSKPMKDGEPRQITVFLKYDGQASENATQSIHIFNTQGTCIDGKELPINKRSILSIPPYCDAGYFYNFENPSQEPKDFSYEPKQRVPFTGETSEVTLNLTRKKWTKFSVKVTRDGAPIKNQEIIINDATQGGIEAVKNLNRQMVGYARVFTDDQGKFCFYGPSGHRFVLYHIDRSPYFLHEDYSDVFGAAEGAASFNQDWELPHYNIVKIKLVHEKAGKRELASDLDHIGLDYSRIYGGEPQIVHGSIPARDGYTALHSQEYGFRVGQEVTFKVTQRLLDKGYTKIISGASLKIDGHIKEHTVVISKDQVSAEVTFKTSDASTGEEVAAGVYYALSGENETRPLFREIGAPLMLEPGTYRIAVAAPGYDLFPATLKLTKSEKRTFDCKLQKNKAVTVSVANWEEPTMQNPYNRGFYLVHSPATELPGKSSHERPLQSKFTVPFDPRLGSVLLVSAPGMAMQHVALDGEITDKLTMTMTPGTALTGQFSPEFATHLLAEAEKLLAPFGDKYSFDIARLRNHEVAMFFFPEDNPYLFAGAVQSKVGENWKVQLMPGTYKVAFYIGHALLRLGDRIRVGKFKEMPFPQEILNSKTQFEPVVGGVRQYANDLFRRLSAK